MDIYLSANLFCIQNMLIEVIRLRRYRLIFLFNIIHFLQYNLFPTIFRLLVIQTDYIIYIFIIDIYKGHIVFITKYNINYLVSN